MKKLLAAVAVLAPAIALLPAAPASASTVCAPITVDGQPVCQDLTPVQQAIANAEATALATAAAAEATALAEYEALYNMAGPVTYPIGAEYQCQTFTPAPSSSTVYVEAVVPALSGDECDGSEITVGIPQTSSPGFTQHVHVPQVCLTTTNTCVGPVDDDLQVPYTLSPLVVCTQPVRWYTNRLEQYTGPQSCTTVPLV